jgi:hypothetical protein
MSALGNVEASARRCRRRSFRQPGINARRNTRGTVKIKEALDSSRAQALTCPMLAQAQLVDGKALGGAERRALRPAVAAGQEGAKQV